MPAHMRQVAAWPHDLADLVDRVTYRPGWVIELRDTARHAGAAGLHLIVTARTTDAYTDGNPPYEAVHYFAVPPAAFDRASWRRWLFDQLCQVEYHEAMEFFRIDDVRPYPPGHGGGHDPYHAKPV